MTIAIRALLVEDDARLAELTSLYLEQHDIIVTTAGNGPAGLALALAEPFDIVLLDLMLPGKSGREVCRALRERSDVPIIMLTARGEEADRVVGFEDGADDYLAKPFSARELVARIQAHVRRARGQTGPGLSNKVIVAGAVSLDPTTLVVTLRGKSLSLTTSEVRLLRVVVERPNRVLSREQILEFVDGDASDAFDRAVDVRISRLRQKLGDDPRAPTLLKTVRGIGYMFSTGGEP